MSDGPPDLCRVWAALSELRGTLSLASADVAERTRAMLAGELPCPDLEEPVPNEVQLSMRVPRDVLKRADRLASTMAADPRFAGLRLTRSTALRAAILRGLDVLEEEHGGARKTQRGK